MELRGRDGRACGSNCVPMKPGGSCLLSMQLHCSSHAFFFAWHSALSSNFSRIQRRDGILDSCSSTIKPL